MLFWELSITSTDLYSSSFFYAALALPSVSAFGSVRAWKREIGTALSPLGLNALDENIFSVGEVSLRWINDEDPEKEIGCSWG